MPEINMLIFDRKEWDNQVSLYSRLYNSICNVKPDASTIQLMTAMTKKDPRIAYYVYRLQNFESDGYYRRRLEQFLSDSDSDDEGPPNKNLFKIEQDFIKDMKRRYCEAEGICWVYVNIGCTMPLCKKKHQLFEPTRKQVIEYFDLFVPKP
jgi:hypothetical protein